ncbi:MAG TPA: carboxypeptidase-like regulatory domain-containing protein, partial [Lunatimonas sp.]|nr:carboxypeptidase-like regulatory domain-containing protein [Lunatimonas sp.]
MKKFLSTLVLGLAACYAVAQHQVTGRIFDAGSNEPLPGANVLVEGKGKGTVSDRSGIFTLSDLEEGILQLRITYVGFETQRVTVNVPSTTPVQISLSQ